MLITSKDASFDSEHLSTRHYSTKPNGFVTIIFFICFCLEQRQKTFFLSRLAAFQTVLVVVSSFHGSCCDQGNTIKGYGFGLLILTDWEHRQIGVKLFFYSFANLNGQFKIKLETQVIS